MKMRILISIFIAMILSGCQTTQQNIVHQESIIDIVAADIRNDLPMRDSPVDEVASCLMGVRYEQDGDIREAINQYLSVGRSQRIEGPWEITMYARLRAALCHISVHENQAAIDILKQAIGCRAIAVGSNRNWSRDNGVTRVTVSNVVGEIDLKYRSQAETLLVALGENLTDIYQSMNNAMATKRLAILRGEYSE